MSTLLGFRPCSKCGESKQDTDFYKNGKYRNNICKACVKAQVISYKHIPDSYAWWYRKLGNIKNSAKKLNIEFTLTYSDYEDIRTEDECYFCKTDCDIVGLTRIDRAKGYTPENTHLICRLCRRFHNYKKDKFNEKELLAIGKVIKKFYHRTRNPKTAKPPEQMPFSYMEDKQIVLDILDTKEGT